MSGIDKLKSGDYNYMRYHDNGDGTVTFTIAGRRYSEEYEFTLKKPFTRNEEMIGHETSRTIPREVDA